MKKHIGKRFLKLCRVAGLKGLGIRDKILLNHIVVLMIPVLVIYFFIYNDYIDDKKESALRLIRMVNSQALQVIDGYLLDLAELTKQPLYDSDSSITSVVSHDPDILQILRNSNRAIPAAGAGRTEADARGPAENPLSLGSSMEETSTVRKVLNRILTFKSSIHSVFLFNVRGDRSDWIMHDNAITRPYDPSGEAWFSRCIALNGSPLMYGGGSFRDLVYRTEDSLHFFSVSRAIKDTWSTEILGVICIYTSVEYLKEICSSIKSTADERILVVDENDLVVYDTDERNIGKQARDAGIPGAGSGSPPGTETGRADLLETAESELSGWKLVRILPEESIYRSVKEIQNRFLVLMMVFIMLSMLWAVGITFSITRPLEKLINTMKVVGRGDLSIRFKVRHRDEIGQLGRNFNVMINRIDHLVNIVYLSRIRKKEAELSALQTQINPHFIYNTLESIRMMAELNDDPSTARMILILGKLLRYNISSKNQLVTVRQELDHLVNYMILQNYRFRDRFETVIDIPQDLCEVSIIRLVFQPIVENAIFHGLETLDRKGLITIRGSRDGPGINFEISDNGVGMTGEQLEELIRNTCDPSAGRKDAKGIGLRNVHERIRLYYGEEFGLRITSEPGKGTKVVLHLPTREKMDNLRL